MWEFKQQTVTPGIQSCGALIHSSDTVPCSGFIAVCTMAWWTGRREWGFSHGRHCPKTKQAAHVSFTISAGVLLSWTQSALVCGSYPVESFIKAQLLTESVLEWTVKSWHPGIQAAKMQHLEVSNFHVKLLIYLSHWQAFIIFRKAALSV